MRVIFIHDAKNLGKKGEVKEVANGYAINFLLPQKIAIIATPEEILKMETKKQKQEKNQKEKNQKAEELKKKIQGIKIEIKSKANEKGALFAALDKEEIAKTLSEKINEKIKFDQIILEEPIKKIGECKICIYLSSGVQAEILLIVKGC